MTIANVALDHLRFFRLIPVVFVMRQPQRVGGTVVAHEDHQDSLFGVRRGHGTAV